MRNYRTLFVVCAAAVSVAAGSALAASVSRTDREFMISAATIDMTAAHEGQMAADHAVRDDVRDFARMLTKDDSESFGHLAELAAKTGVTIPRGIDTARIPAVQGLAALKGSRFDRQFTRDEIANEQRALAVFKREAKYGQNSDVKAYANNMIPVFDNDLKRARQIASADTK